MLLTALALAGTEVVPRAPHAPNVAVGEALLFGPSVVSFTRLELGTPLVFTARGGLGIGITGRAAVTHLWVPDEERSHTQLQHAGLGAWGLVHPGPRTRHALGFTFAWSPEPGGLYAFVVQDAATRYLTLGYRLDHRMEHARFHLAVDTGFDDTGVYHGTLVPTFGYAVVRGIDVEVSGVIGLQPLVAAGLGARFGPFAGFELGAGVFAVASFDRGVPVHALPQATLRYTGRWKKRFVAENPWRDTLEGAETTER